MPSYANRNISRKIMRMVKESVNRDYRKQIKSLMDESSFSGRVNEKRTISA